MSTPQWQLIVYDIRHEKRLRRVHRLLKGCAFALQASVFAWRGDHRQLQCLKKELARRIDPTEDDVRGYPLLSDHGIVWWGKTPLPEGIHVEGFPRLEHRENFGQDKPITH
jgi:CRISPR-associated protein Cas2